MLKFCFRAGLLAAALTALAFSPEWNAWAQPPFLKKIQPGGNPQPGGQQPGGPQGGPNNGPNNKGQATGPSMLSADPALLKLAKAFVLDAEKLARDYERNKQFDKAELVAQEILKIAPNYPPAVEIINGIRQREATADKITLDVMADQGWKATGVVLLAGKPVTIQARGNWTFRLEQDVSAEGIEIPRELRDFKLGALIGVIDTGAAPSNDKDKEKERIRPFHIGAGRQFEPDQTGQLLLRMHDANPADNRGKMTVEIQGTFQRLK